MKSVIINRPNTDMGIPSAILDLLPYRVTDAINQTRMDGKLCEEIRLRCKRSSSLTVSGGEQIDLGVSLSREEMDGAVDRLCGGSLYAHGDTIKNGYISIFGGIRVGVCGRAAIDHGQMIGVSEISSVCIRLPHAIKADVGVICKLLEKHAYSKGVLIYSPPGEGKTTVLRSVSAELSRIAAGAKSLRVAVVDTRGELEYGLSNQYLATDILSGYPKGIGIEIALRTLNANVIICDEIGNEDEAKAVLEVSNGGAALVASAHAYDIESLMSKKSIRTMHQMGVFGAYVGIKRQGSEYHYTVTEREEVGV